MLIIHIELLIEHCYFCFNLLFSLLILFPSLTQKALPLPKSKFTPLDFSPVTSPITSPVLSFLPNQLFMHISKRLRVTHGQMLSSWTSQALLAYADPPQASEMLSIKVGMANTAIFLLTSSTWLQFPPGTSTC